MRVKLPHVLEIELQQSIPGRWRVRESLPRSGAFDGWSSLPEQSCSSVKYATSPARRWNI